MPKAVTTSQALDTLAANRQHKEKKQQLIAHNF